MEKRIIELKHILKDMAEGQYRITKEGLQYKSLLSEGDWDKRETDNALLASFVKDFQAQDKLQQVDYAVTRDNVFVDVVKAPKKTQQAQGCSSIDKAAFEAR